MARGTTIPITLPGEYLNDNYGYAPDFIFKYLKQIGFQKYELIDIVNWDETNKKIYDYHMNLLPESITDIPNNVYLGSLYLLYKEMPELLSYEKLCEIVVEKRGGFSINYTTVNKPNSEILQYKTEVDYWIQEVMEEPYEEIDFETRQAEYKIIRGRIEKYQQSTSNSTTEYITFLRPGSATMKMLKHVIDKLFPVEY